MELNEERFSNESPGNWLMPLHGVSGAEENKDTPQDPAGGFFDIRPETIVYSFRSLDMSFKKNPYENR